MFKKEINTNNREEMIKFLMNHFRYFTMNSWNQQTSYANNVKIPNLELSPELKDKAYDFIDAECEEFNDDVTDLITDFLYDTGYTAAFNGRNNGYLVLYETEFDNNRQRRTILRSIDKYEDFEDWTDEAIAERVELVTKFDILCDDIRDTFIYYLMNTSIEKITIMRPEIHKVARIINAE